MKTAKKLLCLLMTVAMIVSVLAIAPVANAATSSNGKEVLAPDVVDDGKTLDTVNWVGGTSFSATPTASNGFPLIWVPMADAFANTPEGEVSVNGNEFLVDGFFTDTVMLRSPYTANGGQRYVDYNVEGGSYIGFLSYYRNNITVSTLSKMWFNTHGNGVRVMYSTDDGASWSALEHSALFEFTRLSTKNVSQDLNAQLNNLPAYIQYQVSIGDDASTMNWFYEYVGMCHSYAIPENATMVRYIFPEEELILADGSWMLQYAYFFGGAAASATPINDRNYVFTGSGSGSNPNPDPDVPDVPSVEIVEEERGIFYPGCADNLKINGNGNTQYGISNSVDYQQIVFNDGDAYFAPFPIGALSTDDKFDNYSQYLIHGETPVDGERSLTYNVLGDTYFAFNFLTGLVYHDEVGNLIFDRNNKGWQLWISSDNGETYKKAAPSDFYVEKLITTRSSGELEEIAESDCWFGQAPHNSLFTFLANTIHSTDRVGLYDPNVGASHFILGKSYYLPEGTTNAKIVFPDYSYAGNGATRYNLALTGVKASLTPITAESAGSKATVDGVTLPEYDNTFALDTFNKATGAVAAATGSANVNYSYDDSNVYVNVETDADIVDFYYINNINFLQNITGNTVFDLFNIPANVDGDVSSAIGKISYNATTGKFTTDNMGGVFSADEAKDAKATETGVSFIVPRSTVCDKFLFHVAAYNEGDSTMLSTGSINGGSLAGFKTLNFASAASDYTFANGKVNNIKYGTTVNNFIFNNGESVALYNINGEALASNEILRTGTYAVVNGNKYDIILENDVNGDAAFNILDAVTVRNYLLNVINLAPASKKAAGADEVTIVELLSLKDDILAGKTFESEKAYSPKYLSLDKEYSIKNTASAQAIRDYLSSSMTVEGFISATSVGTIAPGVDPTFEADLNTVLTSGAKLITRAGFIWGNGLEMNTHFANSRKYAKYVHDIDSRILLEACIFETIFEETASRTYIPEYVLEAFGEPIESERPFDYWNALNWEYENKWDEGGSVPDLTTLEAQMWCYYLATQYIDAGFDIINLGQIALTAEYDETGACITNLTNMIRAYAEENGRNNNVLLTAHIRYNLDADLIYDDNNALIFDFDTYPSRIYDGDGTYVKDATGYAPCTLKVEYLDSIYGRNRGGVHPQGYTVNRNFYVVELDNFDHSSAANGNPSPAVHFPWGYDEITWFTLQPKAGQISFLNHMVDTLKTTDPGVGYFALPARRNAERTINGKTEYYFNASSLVANGKALEATFRDIYSK